ncbi:hypothetical protein FISHEDRAFT_75502 [Fistulina hepatica ATCC 64428]|uniref:Uncharacterized protein n=1 Tax=Fistulina hepatica ATCC 64428 TaxID=1128425 RepID=A0A0D7A700_9AGAR|nr:hypothetical protein FISHEDRAFT_75502 [Fistulina hepatica ATCC 64428]
MPALSSVLVNSACMSAHTDVQSQDTEWNSTVSFDDSSLSENVYIPDGLLWFPTVSPDVGAGPLDDIPLEIIPLKAPSCPPIERSPSLPDPAAPDPSPCRAQTSSQTCPVKLLRQPFRVSFLPF